VWARRLPQVRPPPTAWPRGFAPLLVGAKGHGRVERGGMHTGAHAGGQVRTTDQFWLTGGSLVARCWRRKRRYRSSPRRLTAEYISRRKRLGTVASSRVCTKPLRVPSASHVGYESG
jgi:hypothetical protein